MRKVILVWLAALLPLSALAGEPPKVLSEREAVDDDGYRVSLSMPTEDDRAAWMQPGLRVELAVEEGYLLAVAPAPRMLGTTFHLRTRLRLDDSWSLAATLGYTLARGDYNGARWTALVEPIFHPLPSLGVSLALGFGGLSLTQVKLPATMPDNSGEIASRTFADGEHLYSCTGGAWAGQARVEYLWVAGPLFSTGPYFVADSQWTACTRELGPTDLETGAPVLGKQWWLNLGAGIGWWFSWR